MAYSEPANVRVRLPALPADNEDNVVDTQIDEGIEYADAEIDAYLGSQFEVPFEETPTLIKGISADLAAAFVLDCSFSGGGEDDETALAKALRDRAMRKLERIRDGDLTIGIDPTEEDETAPDFAVYHSRYDADFVYEQEERTLYGGPVAPSISEAFYGVYPD